MIDFKRYKRFFAFGCSMTNYYWPTWADIISQEIPVSYNYGKSGGGNLFISCQVVEARLKHGFTPDDLIMIMWSGVSREDRYISRNWETPGNIYTQNFYDESYVRKYSDTRGYILRDLSLITMCQGMLDGIGANYYMMNMAPFHDVQMYSGSIDRRDPDNRKLIEFFEQTTCRILPDLLTAGCNGSWPANLIYHNDNQKTDYHPTTAVHAQYLQSIFPGLEFSDNTVEFIRRYENIIKNSSTIKEIEKEWKFNYPERF
jgi:hypothetical protein